MRAYSAVAEFLVRRLQLDIPCDAVGQSASRPTLKQVTLEHCSEAVCTLPLRAAQPALDQWTPGNGQHTV